jgi:hypothetical protein
LPHSCFRCWSASVWLLSVWAQVSNWLIR